MGSGGEETVEEDVNVEDIEETLEEETQDYEMETKPRPSQPRTQVSNDTKSTQCPECGTVYTNRSHMLRHYRSYHKGVKYPSHRCDYQATQQSHLESYIQSKYL